MTFTKQHTILLAIAFFIVTVFFSVTTAAAQDAEAVPVLDPEGGGGVVETEAIPEPAEEVLGEEDEYVDKPLSEASRTRIENLVQNISFKMHAAVNRLNNIADRLESRSDTIAAETSLDVSEAKSYIRSARDLLGSVEESMSGPEEKINDALSSNTPKIYFRSIRDEVEGYGVLIKEAHALLNDTVRVLKMPPDEAENSSTDQDEPLDAVEAI